MDTRVLTRARWTRELVESEGGVAAAASATGISASTLRAWLRPPRQAVPCPTCGAACDPRAARCSRCASSRRQRWTTPALLADRERWRQLHRRAPSSYDWGPQRSAGWPSATTVLRHFDSWDQFLAAVHPQRS